MFSLKKARFPGKNLSVSSTHMNMKRYFLLLWMVTFVVTGCKGTSSKIRSNVDHYTCAMHPSVRSKDPGKCPICGMELVPVLKKNAQASAASASLSELKPNEFTVPIGRRQQIGVTYATVKLRSLSRTIRAVGFIVPDQKRNWSFVSRVEGYVQQLFVASPGEIVEKDAPLLSIYSPDLLTTERELMILLRSRRNATTDRLIQAARFRLHQWNVTDPQIAELEKSMQPSEVLILHSPFRGIVAKVAVPQGTSVKVGDALVDVVDLSEVWVWADFYETEIGLLRQGQKVGVTSVSYPGRTFDGTVAVVDPFVDPLKRTARVRIDVENAEFLLRPGMYVNATLQFEPVVALAIPVEAVMPTGLRNVVFVDKGEGRLESRLITLGGEFGNFYAVRKGLAAGERIVTSANFLIDAESKMQGALKDFDDNHSESSSTGDEANPSLALPSPYEALIKSYLALHALLAADRFEGVNQLGDELRREVAEIAVGDEDMKHNSLKNKTLEQVLNHFKPADLEQARVGFGHVSKALLEVLKEIPSPRVLYVMRCPMWNSSPSEWVQVSKKVENPFLGQAMATCGETIRILGK